MAAATSAMSLAGFSSESEQVALSGPRYWSTQSRESINTAAGGLPDGHSISETLKIIVVVASHHSQEE